MNGRISFGPSAQLMPTLSSRWCEMEFQYHSTVWPDKVRPLRSVIVKETITGTWRPVSSKCCAIANSAALEFSESNTVSSSSKSTPPSSKPRVCSEYAPTSWSKVTARNAGLWTSGERDADLLVGPSAPATKHTRPGCAAITASAATRALRPPATFSS